jgi:hypothetical protein
MGEWARNELAETTFQWRRQFRGEPRVKDDIAVTDGDIAANNLVLWGDPSSNKLLAKVIKKLPVRWDRQSIRIGDKTCDAARHVLVLVYPNPLNPARYVALNTGFTFAQFGAGSNSQQTPKLPDWAVLDLSVPSAERVGGRGVAAADFFDEIWEVPR